MKEWFKKIFGKFKAYFFIEEGGKSVIISRRLKYTLSIFVGATILFQVLMPEDQSLLSKSFKPFENKEALTAKNPSGNAQDLVNAHDKEAKGQVYTGQQSKPRTMKLAYNARQVIERTEAQGLVTPIPSGTNFVGKLINGIDTREDNQVLKVILPYGGRHPSGGSIPKDSILLGNASYSGGDRVYVRFSRVIYPTGQEYKMEAQALSSSDYVPGLVGYHHSETDLRVAGSLALTMVSAGADVLTQRSALGNNPYGMAMAQPDANLKNAGLQGVSQVTKQEAERVGGKMQNKEEYLTVQTGGDLIISLLTPFKGESF